MTKELREIPIEAFESKATIKAYLESEKISTVVTPAGIENDADDVVDLCFDVLKQMCTKLNVKLKNEN
jgi:hypothetical protein